MSAGHNPIKPDQAHNINSTELSIKLVPKSFERLSPDRFPDLDDGWAMYIFN